MKPVVNNERVIINAAVLRDSRITKKRVLCPGCGEKVFEQWPEGWDAHAAHKCAGLESKGQVERKAEFKATFRHLFR